MRKYKITEVITYEFEARNNEEAANKIANKSDKYCKDKRITLEVYKGDELIKKASCNGNTWGFVR
jgi:hypothetical protein